MSGRKLQKKKKRDFVENGNFIKVTTKAAVLGYCRIDLQENTHGETHYNNVEGNKSVNFTTIEFCHRCYPVKRHVYRTPLGNWKS